MSSRYLTLSALSALAVALGLGLAWATPSAADGNVIVVTTTEDDYGSNGGDCSLREAIRAISDSVSFGGCPAGAPGDTIQLQDGATYTLSRNGANEDNNAQGDLDIRAALNIVSSGNAVIDAAGLGDRVVEVLSGPVALEGITIQNGVLVGGGLGGGGIRNWAALTLRRVNVVDNNAGATGFGGGIVNADVNPAVTQAVLHVIESTIRGNLSGEGGGIYNLDLITVTHSSLISNTASPYGGGGLANNAGTATLVNVTLSGNNGADGGGIYNGANLTLNNVTIAANTASSQGGGVQNYGLLEASNSLIGNNVGSPADCSGILASYGYNLVQDSDGCSVMVMAGPAVISEVVGVLGPLGNYGGDTLTHVLLPGSPALNAGNPATPTGLNRTCEVNDQRGYQRTSPCDIGAYDAGGVLPIYLPLVRKQ